MNGKVVIFTGVAIFAGVFGALQADRILHPPVHPDVMVAPSDSKTDVMPVDLKSSDLGSPLDFRVAAKKVIPSVVSVDRYENVSQFMYGDDESGQIQKTGTGSGVIVSADGLIVTNNHVVADENGNVVPEVMVRTSDKRTLKAKVLGNDPWTDVAVLKVEGNNFTPIQLGSSSDLEIGQWVMAVGNPLGFDDTVSVGVVSSLKRTLPIGESTMQNAIQTDAAINPGNSGGALTDQNGRLVGINAAIASSTGGNVGIGFAIPIDRVRKVVNDIVKLGHAPHAGLGIRFPRNADGVLGSAQNRAAFAQEVNADASTVPTTGLIIAATSGPAAQAGMKRGDVLMSVNGTNVNSYADVAKLLTDKDPGDKISMKWWSQGQTHTAEITLMDIGARSE